MHVRVSAGTGDYWRLLVPGKYNLTVQALGYETQSKDVLVTNPEHEPAARLDFQLKPVNVDVPQEGPVVDLESGSEVTKGSAAIV